MKIDSLTEEQSKKLAEILGDHEFSGYIYFRENSIQVDGDLYLDDIRLLAKIAEAILT